MIDESCRHAYGSCCLVGVKTPSVFLPFFDCSSDIIVISDFHTFILFQLDYHPFPVSIILISYFRFGYDFSATSIHRRLVWFGWGKVLSEPTKEKLLMLIGNAEKLLSMKLRRAQINFSIETDGQYY
jgi:hypothetical protein